MQDKEILLKKYLVYRRKPDSVYKLVATRRSQFWDNKRAWYAHHRYCRGTGADLQSKSSVVKRIKCAAGNLLPLSFLFTKFSRTKFVERECS